MADRLAQYGAQVRARLRDAVLARGLPWPPPQLSLVAYKDQRRLEVHAREDDDAPWQLLNAYPVLGASGGPGPKLREGDEQVPEGIYQVQSLNPNSRYHLALRLDYPNAFDRAMAARDGRSTLGGDIMIHGDDFSIGCLAVGDEAARDLFVLAALAGPDNVRVVIAPTDLRSAPPPPRDDIPWRDELYRQLREALDEHAG